jgi:hypothetical protein
MIRRFIGAILIGMFLIYLLAACSNVYQIEGRSTVSSLDGKMLYIRAFDGNDWVTIDSTEVLHGLFHLDGPADSVMMVSVYMDDMNIMPFILEKGNIDISITNTQLSASGTPLNDALYGFVDKQRSLESKLVDLERKEARMVLEGANIDDVQAQIAVERKDLNKETNDYIKGFIAQHYENVLGPAVFTLLCEGMPYPIMTPLIEEIINAAPTLFKEHPDVRSFLEKAKENAQLIEEQQRLQENAILMERTK